VNGALERGQERGAADPLAVGCAASAETGWKRRMKNKTGTHLRRWKCVLQKDDSSVLNQPLRDVPAQKLDVCVDILVALTIN